MPTGWVARTVFFLSRHEATAERIVAPFT